LRGAGLDGIARLDSADEIAAVLPPFLASVRTGRAALPQEQAVHQASRRGRSESFVQLLGAALG
jgi:hypothetical protein